MRRLSIFFDGTWNDPASNTNVWQLHKLVAARDARGIEQVEPYYDPGVGTKWKDKLLGGAVGLGLSQNVRDGYAWLREHYEDGDEVYIFGFSRGAYTARSLGGLIAGCGLARRDAPFDTTYLYDRYQHRRDTATPIYELSYIRDFGRFLRPQPRMDSPRHRRRCRR